LGGGGGCDDRGAQPQIAPLGGGGGCDDCGAQPQIVPLGSAVAKDPTAKLPSFGRFIYVT